MKTILQTFLTEAQYRNKYKVTPAGRHQSEANPRFRDPVHFQLKNPRWKVCQGYISVNGSDFQEMHCWAEYGGMVVDFFYGYRMNQELYYKVHRVEGVMKFNPQEARLLMDIFRTYKWLDKVALLGLSKGEISGVVKHGKGSKKGIRKKIDKK